jgi:hypothetical protein
MTHSALLIAGGALLTCVLGALVFGGKGSAEDERMREERKLLTALEAQRRVRDARRLREERRGRAVPGSRRPAQVEQLEVDEREAASKEQAAANQAQEAERRANEELRKREEKGQAAALKTQRRAEEQERRRAAKESEAAAKAERAERRAQEKQLRQKAKEQTAALEAQDAERRAEEEQRVRAELAPQRAPTGDVVENEKPLAELPLFSWAHQIETEDRAPTETD